MISRDGPAYVIAEVGHNHQGDVEKAKALVRAARESGADAVKLQKRDNARLYTRALYDTPYDNEHSFGRTYGEHREALELSASEWLELREFSKEEGMTLFGTVFDEPSADLLAELDLGVIGTYRDRFPDLVVGLSDHQSGIAMSLVAYMLGARVIEKHFTLNHAWKGS